MITIRLMVGGKEQEYVARGVNLRASFLAYSLYKEYTEANGDYSDDLLERCADFVCEIFGHAFSVDELMGGYMGTAFRLFPSLFQAVIGYSNEAIVNFPETATGTAATEA